MEYNTHIYNEGDPLYGTWEDDWRLLVGYDSGVNNLDFQHRLFDRTISIEDFDLCEYCHKSFDEDEKHPIHAYYCQRRHFWVCETCFQDFKDHFGWTAEELNEDIPLDAKSRLIGAFDTIVYKDPRPIIVSDCQHQVRFINDAAKSIFSDTLILDKWWGPAFPNQDEVWAEVKKRFDILFNNPEQDVTSPFLTNGFLIHMTAIRNRRGELMGYYFVVSRCQG